MQHVDTLDRQERDWQVQVEVSRFRVVHAETIDQHEGLLKGCTAYGYVRHDSAAAPLLDVDGGIGAQVVFDLVECERSTLRIQAHYGASGVLFGDRYRAAENNNGGVDGRQCRLLLCVSAGRQKRGDEQEQPTH